MLHVWLDLVGLLAGDLISRDCVCELRWQGSDMSMFVCSVEEAEDIRIALGASLFTSFLYTYKVKKPSSSL